MPQKWFVLAAVACGTFMATLDASVINIALPTLTKALSSELFQVKWVVIIYLLVITCLLLPFGRLADLYGRRKIFTFGYFVFTLGSGLSGLSSSLQQLLVARAVQGVGAAMLMANGPAIITSVFPAGERGKALGTMAMVVSAGLISGPSVGGMLIGIWGWPSIFLLNLPFGLLGIMLVTKFVPKEHGARKRESFDWGGAFLQLLVLLSFIATMEGPSLFLQYSGTPFSIHRSFFALMTLLIAAVFIQFEARSPSPLIDLSLLRIRTFWTANLGGFLIFVATTSVTVLMPFYLDQILHLSPSQIGLTMTAIPLTILFVAPIAGRISDRFGTKPLSFLGALIATCGLLVMSGVVGEGINENTSRRAIIACLSAIGLAIGVFQSPNNSAILSSVPLDKLGIASALLATIRNLGLVTGTTVATVIFAWRKQVTGDFITALHFTYFFSGLVTLGALLASLGHKKKKRGQYA